MPTQNVTYNTLRATLFMFMHVSGLSATDPDVIHLRNENGVESGNIMAFPPFSGMSTVNYPLQKG